MTEREVMISAKGRDEDGESNAKVNVKISKLNINTKEEKIINERVIEDVEVDFFRNLHLTAVDLKFPSDDDYDLVNLTARLNEFATAENSIDDENGELPMISITIVPIEFDGEYIISCTHSMWMLTAEKPNQPMDTIRFICINEDFQVFEMPDSEEDELEEE